MTGPFFPGAHVGTEAGKPAVVMAGSGESLTFGALDAVAHEIALALRSLGLDVGDHVCI